MFFQHADPLIDTVAVPSDSTGTIRNLGEDIDRLADDLRSYNQARGMESQELTDQLRTLRGELHDLADFLHRAPSPRPPIAITTAPAPVPAPVPEGPRRGVQLVDRRVGGSSVMSLLIPGGPRVMEMDALMSMPAASLGRSASTSSTISYLSSHHSDDDLFEEDTEVYTAPSAPRRQPTEESSSACTIQATSSSSRPSSPLPEPPSEATVQPPPTPDPLLESLNELQDQIRALENGQDADRNLLFTIRDQPLPVPVDHHPELEDRLQRMEDLIQILIDQGHPRGPSVASIVHESPVASEQTSISKSTTDSLGSLGALLQRIISAEAPPPHIPVPITARSGPSMVQQLDEILSAPATAPVTIEEPPRLEPFVYRPAGSGRRPRSASPVLMETLPPRTLTIPLLPTQMHRRPPRSYPIQRSRAGAPSGALLEPETESQAPGPPINVPNYPLDARKVPDRSRRPAAIIPPPQPVVSPRPSTAPLGLGGGRPDPGSSRYRPPRQRKGRVPAFLRPEPAAAQSGQPQPTQPTTHRWCDRHPRRTLQNVPATPVQTTPAAPTEGRSYMPMPAGPTVVQLPPLFDSLGEILRENRLAQFATVDQQRELMRYMRGLNEWLVRTVHDRQSGIRGVGARIDRLRNDIRGTNRGA